jgi:hypothetical protein
VAMTRSRAWHTVRTSPLNGASASESLHKSEPPHTSTMWPPRVPSTRVEMEEVLEGWKVEDGAPLAQEVGFSLAAGYTSGLALRFVGRCVSRPSPDRGLAAVPDDETLVSGSPPCRRRQRQRAHNVTPTLAELRRAVRDGAGWRPWRWVARSCWCSRWRIQVT